LSDIYKLFHQLQLNFQSIQASPTD